MFIMIFPQEFIEKVKNSLNIVDIAKQYTQLEKLSGGVWRGRCPNPKHTDNDPSFTLWEKSQTWCCYGCHVGKRNDKDNYGSDIISFIMWIEGMRFMDAVLYLANIAGLPIPTDENSEEYKKHKKMAKIYNNSLLNNENVLSYLYKRGLDTKDISNWMLGYDGASIIFPLFDRYRNILGFSRRKYLDSSKMNSKYKNPPNSHLFTKSEYLYGIHNMDNSIDEIRIVEGPFDAVLSNKYKVKNVMAIQGTAVTDKHVQVIKSLNKKPILCLDNDIAGKQSILKAIELFNEQGIQSKVCILPREMDMADLANLYKSETEDYISQHTVMYSQYLLSNIMTYYDVKVNEIKADIVPQINSILNNITNSDERFVLHNYIKEKTGLNFSKRSDKAL